MKRRKLEIGELGEVVSLMADARRKFQELTVIATVTDGGEARLEIVQAPANALEAVQDNGYYVAVENGRGVVYGGEDAA